MNTNYRKAIRWLQKNKDAHLNKIIAFYAGELVGSEDSMEKLERALEKLHLDGEEEIFIHRILPERILN